MKKSDVLFKVVVGLIVASSIFVWLFLISYLNVFPYGMQTGITTIGGYYVKSDYGDDVLYSPASEPDPEQIIFLIDNSEDQALIGDLETGDRIQIRFGGLLDQDENGIWSLTLTEKVTKRITWFQVLTDDEIAQVNEQAAILHCN